jgi:hypothetical protein
MEVRNQLPPVYAKTARRQLPKQSERSSKYPPFSVLLDYTVSAFQIASISMSKLACLFCALCVVLQSPRAFADIAAIHAGSLPQEVAVLNSLKDATELEPYARSWTQNWKYPVAKTDAAARLGVDLASLNSAVKAHPDNAELLLLTGLVAHYAYNVDLPGSHDTSLAALAAAERLDKADFRAPWFRATLLCQTTQLAAGADQFLAIENGNPWERLPAAFWADYMECATLAKMPAHALRAEDHLEKLHAPATDMRTALADANRKRSNPFDPTKEYAQKDVWEYEKVANQTSFTSTSCGLRMHVQSGWAVDRLELAKGSCVADFSTGPYNDTPSKMRPSILVMVQQPVENETLDDYVKRLSSKGGFVPFTPSRCPADRCVAITGTKPGAYGTSGDGRALMLIFERDQPEFPGLAFESPSQPSPPAGGAGMAYYRPSQTQQRIPGKLYYVVLLDTAASIEEPAMKDFEFFLQQLTVE